MVLSSVLSLFESFRSVALHLPSEPTEFIDKKLSLTSHGEKLIAVVSWNREIGSSHNNGWVLLTDSSCSLRVL
jgi:hypothetical protein